MSSRRTLLYEDDLRRNRRRRWLIALLWISSLVVLYLLMRYVMMPDFGQVASELAHTRRALLESRAEIEQLQQQLALHQRGEQVAENANKELQQALAGRQEEIASLRNDLSFFQRLMEGGAQQAGLAVHSLSLRATDDPRSFQFALTLSQNLKRNRQASGRVELFVSGANGEQSKRLGLDALGGTGPGLEFSFKYFQQLTGLIMLPEGFKPGSVSLKVIPEGGSPVEREFMWKDVIQQGS